MASPHRPPALTDGEAVLAFTRFPAALAPGLARSLAALAWDGADGRSPTAVHSLVGRALARRLLRWLSGGDAPAVTVGQDGKPRAGCALALSVAHGDGVAAAAVGRSAGVGIDIEPHREAPMRLLQRRLHPDDAERLQGLSPPERAAAFTQLWTILEACGKVSGSGVRVLSGAPPIGAGSAGAWQGCGWRVVEGVAGHAASIAAAGCPPHVAGCFEVSLEWVAGRRAF